jgi:TolA-binding protein
MLSACAGTAQLEERTRTALEATNAAIDPAYAAATEGCIVRVQAIERAYDQGFKPAYDAANELESVHKQCNKTRSVFATIRTLYNEAVKLYNDGRFAEALAAYADITRAWASLNGGTK